MEAISELAKQGRWTIRSVTDLGSVIGRCGVCGKAIRYEYHVHQVGNVESGRPVGSTCGPTLVQASWSESYWKETQAAFEKQMGRALTQAEIEARKKEHSKAEWKRMAKEFVALQQEEAKKVLPAMLERYVALRPWHNFSNSILQQMKNGRRLTPKQIEAVNCIIAETDWDELERQAAQQKPVAERVLSAEERDESGEPDLLNRLNALIALRDKMPFRTNELVDSFMEQLAARGSLSQKQLDIVTDIESRISKPVAKPVQMSAPADTTVSSKQMIDSLVAQGRLSEKQKAMLTKFKAQASLSDGQASIVKDIFGRLKPTVVAEMVDEAQFSDDGIPF